ncbi:transporter substrate-binding domain-containing protein [Terrihabitans sp. B22-R8]|uniref:transporter substrate-binding domain-containing protein n=1 Tax=Terrihabitans sp. B22-R8 TaxID=3425128 RepID=UPI00403D03AB
MMVPPLPASVVLRSASRRMAWCALGLGVILSVPQVAFAAPQVAETIRIGVPYLPPPQAATDVRLYTEEGFEIDIAREIARHLGRTIELVTIAPAETETALTSGRVDAVINRVPRESENPSFIELVPAGFVSGASVAMRTDTNIHDWPDLSGRVVCVSQANRAGQALARSFGARIRIERAPAGALMAVRTGECDAALHDRALLDALFKDDSWSKFSATLPATAPSTLVVALPRQNSPLLADIRAALPVIAEAENWEARRARWARNVAFEVYLDQEAPDCH